MKGIGDVMYDVIIIGAGVCGCAIARELSKYSIKILVLEYFNDVCEGTSKANSGIVHAGFDAKPGTLKAKLNRIGNEKMEQLSTELDIPFSRNGSLVLGKNEEELVTLHNLKEQGRLNGVKGLELFSAEEVKKLEPNISEHILGALHAPTGGIVCPFALTIALAENAYVNEVEFLFNTKVIDIRKTEHKLHKAGIGKEPGSQEELRDSYVIYTNRGEFSSKLVINAAGVYADDLNNKVSQNKLHITPRKGEYCLFDKKVGNYIAKTIFQVPNKFGKGVLVTPTVHGNLLIGPTAMEIDDKCDVSTTECGLEEILNKAKDSIKLIPTKQIITSFGGLRAHEDNEDFIIGESPDSKGFINVAGIESPGLTCAPAIGMYVEEIVINILHPKKKEIYVKERKGIPDVAKLSKDDLEKLINKDRTFANVICRCEMVTEGEILAAIHRPLGATTLDGIKRRVRAGMGRCQSGFCSPKVLKILSRELNKDLESISKFGRGSTLLIGNNKSGLVGK